VTTILAPATAGILRGAADLIDALHHHRINRTDLHKALLKAAPSYHAAQDALTVLHQATRGEDWLTRWSDTTPRSQASMQLRDVAAAVTR
jgi:hypothetical protein